MKLAQDKAVSFAREASAVEKAVNVAKSGLFGALYSLAQDPKRTSALCVMYTSIEMLQMVSFPLSPAPMFPWTTSAQWSLNPIARALKLTTLSDIGSDVSEVVFLVLFGAAVTWIALLLGLLYWAAYSSVKQLPMNRLVLKFMRGMATWSQTFLFLPVTTLMLEAMQCGTSAPIAGYWHGTAMKCNSSGHIATIICCLVLLVAFVVTVTMIAFVFIDRSPLSRQLAARVTGRLEALLLCCKTLLAFVFSVLLNRVPFGLVAAVLIGVGVFWLVWNLSFLPHVIPWMNDVKIGGAALYCWVLGCLILVKSLGVDAGVAVLFGGPLAGVCGALLTRSYIATVSASSLHELRTASLAAIWARTRLQQALGKRNRDSSQQDFDAIAEDEQESTSMLPQRSHGKRRGVRQDAADKECMAQLREAEQGFRKAVKLSPQSGLVHLQLAEFYHIAHRFNFTEIASLQKALQSSSALDVQFFVYQRSRQLQEMKLGKDIDNTAGKLLEYLHGGVTRQGAGVSGHNSGNGSLMDQTAFEKCASAADEARLAYFKQQSDLLAVLADPQPDFAVVERHGHALASLRKQMASHYLAMLQLNDSSLRALRSYAAFLDEVMHDSEQASEFLTRARRIEDSYLQHQSCHVNSLAFGTVVGNVHHMDEHDAVMVITGAAHRLGEIVSANSRVATLLGVQRLSVVGRLLSSLFAPPVSTWLQDQLVELSDRGDCHVMDKAMLLPLLDSAGNLTPVVLHLREHPPDDSGGAPQLLAILKPVQCSSEILLFDTVEHDYAMIAATPALIQRIRSGKLQAMRPGQIGEGGQSLAAKQLMQQQLLSSISGSLLSDVQGPVSQWIDVQTVEERERAVAEGKDVQDMSGKGAITFMKAAVRVSPFHSTSTGLLSGCAPFHQYVLNFNGNVTTRMSFLSSRHANAVAETDEAAQSLDAGSYANSIEHAFSESSLRCPHNEVSDSHPDSDGLKLDNRPRMHRALASVSSSGSSAFRHNIKRVRRELSDPDAKNGDLRGMVRGVRGLALVLAVFCAAVLIAFQNYAVTLNAYGRVLLSQGFLIRSARMFSKAVSDAAYHNMGFTEFGPLSERMAEAVGYIDEFNYHFNEVLSALPHVHSSLSEERRASSVEFMDVRSGGVPIQMDLNLNEAANMFLVRARQMVYTNPANWSVYDPSFSAFTGTINGPFTTANNATYISMIERMVDAMNLGAQIALITFLCSFLLLAVVLVAQFIVGIRKLAAQNFSALVCLAKVPKDTINHMKERSEERYLQFHAEVDPDGDDISSILKGDSDSEDEGLRSHRSGNGRSHEQMQKRRRGSVASNGSSGVGSSSLNWQQDTTKFATKNTVLLTLPLAMVMLWFTAVYVIETHMALNVWSHASQQYIVQQMSLTTIEMMDHSIDPWLVGMPQRQQLFEVTNMQSGMLRDAMQALINGGDFLGRPVKPANDDAVSDALLNRDACFALTVPEGNTADPGYINCTRYMNGVFHQSLFTVVMKLSDVAQQMQNTIPLNNDTNLMTIATSGFTTLFVEYDKIENPYFRNITSSYALSLCDELYAKVADCSSTLTTLSVVFVILYALFVVAVYIPMIRRVGKHVTLTQSILLLFNDDQLADLHCLRMEVRSIVTHSGGMRGAPVTKQIQATATGLCRMLCKKLRRGASKRSSVALKQSFGSTKIIPVECDGLGGSVGSSAVNRPFSHRLGDTITPPATGLTQSKRRQSSLKGALALVDGVSSPMQQTTVTASRRLIGVTQSKMNHSTLSAEEHERSSTESDDEAPVPLSGAVASTEANVTDAGQ